MNAAVESSRRAAAWLIAGGIAIAIGGQMHPRGSGETVDDYIGVMLESGVWNFSHLAAMLGLVLGVIGLLVARRADVFGATVRPWLTFAIVGWSFGAAELVPHVLAVNEHDALLAGGSTPLLDSHLTIQMLATPLVGLSTIGLAVAVAREARTKPAWGLAVPAILGGFAYALSGPVINLTSDPSFAPLFAGQAGMAIWMIGTALRLRSAVRVEAPSQARAVAERAPAAT